MRLGRTFRVMNPIDHVLRLLDTQDALWGVVLAAVAVFMAVGFVVRRAVEDDIRLVPAVLIVAAGFLAGTVIVEASYYSWWRHRCVLHHSDIDACSATGGWLDRPSNESD